MVIIQMLVPEPKPQLVCWVRGWSGLIDQLFRDNILGGRLASCLGTLVLDSWERWFWRAGNAGSGQLQCMLAFVPTQLTNPQDHA